MNIDEALLLRAKNGDEVSDASESDEEASGLSHESLASIRPVAAHLNP